VYLLICCVVCVCGLVCCRQVLLSTAVCCWGLTSSARLVVIMGTQFYDGTGLGASDYPVTDLLQMLGRASRPGVDEVRGRQDVGGIPVPVQCQRNIQCSAWWGGGAVLVISVAGLMVAYLLWAGGDCEVGAACHPAWMGFAVVYSVGQLRLQGVCEEAMVDVKLRPPPTRDPVVKQTSPS